VTASVTSTASTTLTVTVPSATRTLTVTATFSQTPLALTATSTPTPLPGTLSIKPVKFYPNPINPVKISDFIISYNFSPGTDKVTVKIYTVAYRLIKEYVFDEPQMQQVIMQGYIQCDTGRIADLSEGIYYYVVITDNQGTTQRPVVGKFIILK
jgi:hypothetical protein